jgi:hypothetical protein
MHYPCEIAGCTRPTRNRRSGACHMHYERKRRHGSTEPGPRARLPLSDRFWRYVQQGDGCWIWAGSKDSKGYGQISSGGRQGRRVLAHRLSYTIAKGQIPEGLDLDHLCRNPACVNPDHLEPVTRGENTRRGNAAAATRAARAAKPNCKHGHAWTPTNTYTDPHGHRRCRTCERANDQRQKAKLKEARRVRRNTSVS